ncbi:MAG: GNAT family N-acetyltransferase [Sandaracinus sp.]|nr:GNAT family N-acetyltransferase [Sandaracinus sp.]MCB9619158.1 GNAT family N-acetyltransferase [Sandaracinus sp.]MCB9632740.1 GNAT family N-acetyltransferase [Sandaracinus sp.]
MPLPLSPTPRTTLRRHPERAELDRAELYALLDACEVVHVAVGGETPTLLPMAFGRLGDRLYLHGAVANALLRGGATREVCVSATKVDGLVLAKSAFHHSMNFRSAVIFGTLEVVEGDEAIRALEAIVDHTLPGRSLECRAPSPAELRATVVAALDLREASMKVRSGGPRDAATDDALPHWAGVLPLAERMDAPIGPSEVPPSVAAAALRRAPHLDGERHHDAFVLSGDPTRLDLPRLYAWLRDTYWATDLDPARLLRCVQGSFVVGAYDTHGTQLGFARAVTDGETFGWLADVYVAPEARHRGLARAMTAYLVEHPRLERLRRWLLGTRDAHGVYGPAGFGPPTPERFLERRR